MEWLTEGFWVFIRGFGVIFFTAIILWMAGLIFLLFRELFSSLDFIFKEYMQRIWKMLLFFFRYTPYGFMIVAPAMLFITKDYLNYTMLTIDAVILSFLFSRWRHSR